MNLFKTLAMVGLVGVGVVYGEETTSKLQIVSNSSSPNGKLALFYRMTHPKGGDVKVEIFLLSTTSPFTNKSLTKKSPTSLQRDVSSDSFGDEMLLEQIASNDNWHKNGEETDKAFSYFVNWSPNSEWFSIDGGAHKFSHIIAYHWTGTNCLRINIPQWDNFKEYLNNNLSNPSIKNIRIKGDIQKSFMSSSYAYWVDNGVLAYSTFPNLCYRWDANAPKYFLIDCKTQPKATITGFAELESHPIPL